MLVRHVIPLGSSEARLGGKYGARRRRRPGSVAWQRHARTALLGLANALAKLRAKSLQIGTLEPVSKPLSVVRRIESSNLSPPLYQPNPAGFACSALCLRTVDREYVEGVQRTRTAPWVQTGPRKPCSSSSHAQPKPSGNGPVSSEHGVRK